MICCSFCPYTLECWVFKTAHWIFKTGFYPCNGDEKLKKGENGGNLTLCWSANLELVANLLGSQSIWGNQMGGPEIRILERDRPKVDQIRLAKSILRSCFAWKSHTNTKPVCHGLTNEFLHQLRAFGWANIWIKWQLKSHEKDRDYSTMRMNPDIKGCEVDPVNRINYWAAFARFCQSTNAHLAHQSILII